MVYTISNNWFVGISKTHYIHGIPFTKNTSVSTEWGERLLYMIEPISHFTPKHSWPFRLLNHYFFFTTMIGALSPYVIWDLRPFSLSLLSARTTCGLVCDGTLTRDIILTRLQTDIYLVWPRGRNLENNQKWDRVFLYLSWTYYPLSNSPRSAYCNVKKTE